MFMIKKKIANNLNFLAFNNHATIISIIGSYEHMMSELKIGAFCYNKVPVSVIIRFILKYFIYFSVLLNFIECLAAQEVAASLR